MLITLIYTDNIMKNKVENFLYEKESFKIRGACFKVFNALGGGIKEKIIVRALIKELITEGMVVENQKRIDIVYKNEKIGVYIPDLVVNDKIIIEIKSKPYLTKEDEKQFCGYLKNSRYKLGFLVIFSPSQVLNYGTWEDLKLLYKLYPEKEIKKIIKNPRRGVWFRKVLNFWTKIFNIKLKKEIFEKAIFR